MPKAKMKRKGAPASAIADFAAASDLVGESEDQPPVKKSKEESCYSIINLPEEMICQILAHLPLSAVGAMEQVCRHLRTVIIHARFWRRILMHTVEWEPGLRDFLPDFSSLDRQELSEEFSSERDSLSYKQLLEQLKVRLDYVWLSAHSPSVSRTSHVFGELEEQHFLYHIMSTGRYFLSFWGPMKTDSKHQKDYIIDVFDRATHTKVRRLSELHGKPDIVRVVSELGIVLLSYPSLLMVEVVRLESVSEDEPREYIDLARGEPETGSICDIVVRDQVTLQGALHRRVVLVAMNTEPLYNRQVHIGRVAMYALGPKGEVGPPLWRTEFKPVPLVDGPGRFFNQCIQKKGLTDFTDGMLVAVIGGCEGSAVLAVVELNTKAVRHRLQLSPQQLSGGDGEGSEGGCEGGACQYSVVSLMIDKRHTELCAVLLSTGQLNVIHLPSGATLFHKHLEFDGQLKLALHQPRFSGTQRIAIKFRNFVNFYDLNLSSVQSEISLKHIRTLRITSVDGRETRLDDNPSQELRRQFGELQKRVRALNNYTSGIQKKLDKGLRPGTVTQGVLSMTRKVQLVTSKLDQAHGKAREIEAIVIASIAFDNRFCHALTLNRDLVVFDLMGALETYNMERRGGAGCSQGRGALCGLKLPPQICALPPPEPKQGKSQGPP